MHCGVIHFCSELKSIFLINNRVEEAKSARSKLKQTSGYEDKVKMSRFNLEIGNEFKKFMGVAVAVAVRVTVSVSVCCKWLSSIVASVHASGCCWLLVVVVGCCVLLVCFVWCCCWLLAGSVCCVWL